MKTSTQASRLRALRQAFYALKEIEIVLEKAKFGVAVPLPVATVGDLVMPGWYTDFVHSAMLRTKGIVRSAAQQQAARATATAITKLRRRRDRFTLEAIFKATSAAARLAERVHIATMKIPAASKGRKKR